MSRARATHCPDSLEMSPSDLLPGNVRHFLYLQLLALEIDMQRAIQPALNNHMILVSWPWAVVPKDLIQKATVSYHPVMANAV